MNKDEARKLIGREVHAWTALRGTYHGILREVITKPGKPWRGRVEITEQLASAFGRDDLDVGDFIEVGHSSIRLAKPKCRYCGYRHQAEQPCIDFSKSPELRS